MTFGTLFRAVFSQLRGRWGVLIGSGVCYSLIMGTANHIAGNLIAAILLAPMTAGWVGICLDTMRGAPVRVGMLFSRFNDYGRLVWGVVRPVLFTLLWGLLFIIPGIIASLRYSQSLMLMLDDPALDAKEAMKQSAVLMKGHKWQLFGYNLLLTLIVLPLTLLTLGIALLWIVPFLQCFQAQFFLSLRGTEEMPEIPGSMS